MSDQNFLILYRFRYFFCGLLVVASLLILSLLLSVIGGGQAQATSANQIGGMSTSGDNPNVITDGFNAALEDMSNVTDATLSVMQGLDSGIKQATESSVTATVNTGKFIARGTYGVAIITAHGIGKSVSFAVQTPVYAWHGVSSVAHIGSFIKPAENDKSPVPRIDPAIADEITASKPADGAVPAVSQTDTAPQWPIHGIITEEFGVPHWPWQPVHTGIDISDGARQGVTPIRPYKPGRVIAVVHSSYGFGNHVIVDHGNGLTSLYGHMYATAVQVGQLVDKNSILGYEGTTGASTGVHVHFELDLNSQPVNPHLYVQGQP